MADSRRPKSSLWLHFVKMDNKGKCRYCHSEISLSRGTTSNLRRHLINKHPTVIIDQQESRSRSPSASNPYPQPSGSKDSDTFLPDPDVSGSDPDISLHSITPLTLSSTTSPKAFDLAQSTMHQYVNILKPIPLRVSQDIDTQLLKVICKEYQPFSIVENEEFIKLFKMLNPNYKLPSRKALSNNLLESVYFEIMEKVKIIVQKSPAVCVTCDGWTNINSVSFYAVTAHFIDEETNLKSALLDCSEFSNRHTANNIAKWLEGVLNKFGINSKVCAVVTDNAANIKAAIASLKLSHISCFAHSLNLVVKSAISSSVNTTIDKIKTTVQFFKQSSHATAKLTEMQRNMKMTLLKLKKDVPTRWNSTYTMVERFLKNKEAIIAVLALVSYQVTFEEGEWQLMKQVVDILEVFFDVTEELSASKNVSISKISIFHRGMRSYVSNILEKELSPNARKLGETLLQELAKRFGAIESIYLIGEAIFLDPRYKREGFGEVSRFKETQRGIIERVKELIESSNSRVEPDLQAPEENQPKQSYCWQLFKQQVIQNRGVLNSKASAIIEVDKYLAEPHLPMNLDPLVWWDTNKRAYPNLYTLALKRLNIPATSVPCERIFSKAGQLMTEKRSRLTSNKLSKMLFINSNSALM